MNWKGGGVLKDSALYLEKISVIIINCIFWNVRVMSQLTK